MLKEAIQPIVDWCDQERGRKTAFITAVQEAAAPEALSFNVIASWLAPDPATRTQPLLGNGLLLLDTFKRQKRK